MNLYLLINKKQHNKKMKFVQSRLHELHFFIIVLLYGNTLASPHILHNNV